MKQGIHKNKLKTQVDEEVQHLQNRLAKERALNADYRKTHGSIVHLIRNLGDAIIPLEPLTSFYKPVTERMAKGSMNRAVMMIADPHVGENQPASEVEGFGEYNWQICQVRNIGYANIYNTWLEGERMRYPINQVDIVVVGDSVSGNIHKELEITAEFPVPVQAVNAGQLLALQVGIVAGNAERVVVHMIGADNHGRLAIKPQSKDEGYNNWNYVVAEIARLHLRDHKNVEFNYYPMHETVIHVGSRQYLLSHGHNIRGWMGIPWYSIERKVRKEADARMQIIMEARGREMDMLRQIGFHRFIFGHWHINFKHPRYVCCGTPKGTDAYDHKDGRHCEPMQFGWRIHPQHGEQNWMDFTLNSLS
jgi:hypothetical protein